VSTQDLASISYPAPDFSVQIPLGPIIAEGRVLDAVAGSDLCGTLDDIADALGITYNDLRTALDELVAIGWVTLDLHTEGRILLSLPEDARAAS
jgi:DNA-binding MarR family transcriptional regulator